MRYEEPQTRYDRAAATLSTLKADDGAVSPDPRMSPVISRSHKRDEASSVRNKTERAREKVICHTGGSGVTVKSAPYMSQDGY